MKKWIPSKEAYKLFHDGTIALSEIESNGIRVNLDYLNKEIENVKTQIKDNMTKIKEDPINKTWKRRFGNRTQLGSKAQLAEVIFKVLGHQEKKEKTAKGHTASDEGAFAHIDSPFLRMYFQNEKLKKALTTYLYGIRREAVDSYIHPNFNLAFTITYRSSSDNPNFQNIPKRNERMAAIIRRCYIPREGHQLCEIDFSGAEVRVSACYNKDPVLIKYIKDPTTDMHRDTACQMFMLEPDQVDKKGPRDCCKNMFVFPEFYGSVWFQCAPHMWDAMLARKFKIKDTEDLVVDHLRSKGIKKLGECEAGVDPKPGTFAHHVREVEKDFWEKRFKVYTEWKRSFWESYQRDGGFRMYTGFVCQGVLNRNDVLNYAVQGASFHCLLWSLVQIHKWLKKNKMRTKIVGQIHDSIVADVYAPEKDDFLGMCKQVMTIDLLKHWKWLIVPMDIEAEIGELGASWHELKGVNIP